MKSTSKHFMHTRVLLTRWVLLAILINLQVISLKANWNLFQENVGSCNVPAGTITASLLIYPNGSTDYESVQRDFPVFPGGFFNGFSGNGSSGTYSCLFYINGRYAGMASVGATPSGSPKGISPYAWPGCPPQ